MVMCRMTGWKPLLHDGACEGDGIGCAEDWNLIPFCLSHGQRPLGAVRSISNDDHIIAVASTQEVELNFTPYWLY